MKRFINITHWFILEGVRWRVMKRRVIQLAGRTLVVSLPSDWAKEFGIKKGDELEISKEGRRLIILTGNYFESLKGTLQASNFGEFVQKRISTAYKRGIEELEVRYSNPAVLKDINDSLQYLMGYEIVQQGKGFCVIKNIAGTTEEEFDVILRRIFLLLLDMSEEGLNAIKQKEFSKLKDISLSEFTNDKLTNVCKRLINKSSDTKKSSLLYCIVWELEKIADDYERIFLLLSEKKKISEKVKELLEETNDFLRKFYEMYYSFSDEKGVEFTKQKNKLHDKGLKLLSNTSEPELLHNILNLIKRIDALAGPFYGMVL